MRKQGEKTVVVRYPIEAATAADLEALGMERVKQGWHANLPLLRMIIEWEQGGRIFVLREGTLGEPVPAATLSQETGATSAGMAPVATTSAIAAGPIGVVGNVIVREDYRRRGLGRVMMDAAVAWMREQGVRAVVLDATRAGRPLYSGMGFVGVERSYYAWGPLRELDRAALRDLAGGRSAQRVAPTELLRVTMLDEQAFGGDRLPLLAGLLREPGAALYFALDSSGAPAGYLVGRPVDVPREGLRVGPWIAREPAVAAALLECALGDGEPWRAELPAALEDEWRLALSLPQSSTESHALLRAIGVHVEEDDLVMRLDLDGPRSSVAAGPVAPVLPSASLATHPEWVYAWIAPMVF
jgi:GNAT superfamily N-acetyltransferase